MPAPRKYDEETRARAVRMYQERIPDLGESKLTARRAGGHLGWGARSKEGQVPVDPYSLRRNSEITTGCRSLPGRKGASRDLAG